MRHLVARYSCMIISPPGKASSKISSEMSFPGHCSLNGISYVLWGPQDKKSILESIWNACLLFHIFFVVVAFYEGCGIQYILTICATYLFGFVSHAARKDKILLLVLLRNRACDPYEMGHPVPRNKLDNTLTLPVIAKCTIHCGLVDLLITGRVKTILFIIRNYLRHKCGHGALLRRFLSLPISRRKSKKS